MKNNAQASIDADHTWAFNPPIVPKYVSLTESTDTGFRAKLGYFQLVSTHPKICRPGDPIDLGQDLAPEIAYTTTKSTIPASTVCYVGRGVRSPQMCRLQVQIIQ